MKEYPATSRAFKVNGKTFKMKKFTLGLQADIEDENIVVTYKDVVSVCTDMTEDNVRNLDDDQMQAIFNDLRDFTYDTEKSGDGEPKKP